MNRTHALSICVLTALALLTFAPQTPAAKPQRTGSPAVVQILPDATEASVLEGDRRFSLETGAPLALYRVGYRVEPGDPKTMAAQYLRENVTLLHLAAADLNDIEHRWTWSSPAGTTVRFRQTVAGIPLYGAEIAVTLDNDATVVFVMNGYKPGITLGSTVPVVTAHEARRAAIDYLQARGGFGFDRTRLVVHARSGVSRLAWEVKLVPRTSPIGDWEVLIDAHTGEIFKVVDNALSVDGSSNIFNPDPLSSAGASYGDPGFTDGGDADTTQLTGQLFNMVLRDITLNGGTYSLVGPYAAIGDFESPFKGTFAQSSPSFAFTRTQDGFEAVNTYYHIDNIMRYLNLTLGVPVKPFQYKDGVQYDPHGLSGTDNSHYVPSTGRLAFGEGGVDDAEDVDVVIHELGHGLHDWVTGGSLSQVNGLSEGVGDFVAASYSRSLGQWTPADSEYNWVFNWDGHNPFWGGRITNYTGHYPEDLTGQIHTDGQIWSTCMMRVWDQIGRDQTERAHWTGLGMTNSNSNQEDAAQAVLTAAVNLGYSATEVGKIESVFLSCGYNVSAPCVPTCGNNVIECNEVCDGTALGGETCGSQGCSGGGTLACNATCDGFDTSGCSGCTVCDNDGQCELGEDCSSCPSDCVSGTSQGAQCDNGICEAGDGENCVNCPADCNGKQNGKPANRFCCGDGGGVNPLGCSDSRCNTGGFSCTNVPATPGTFCCGDLTCEGDETCSNCALDCTVGAEVCSGGNDEDCDGFIDCSDPDCTDDPACVSTCADVGESCRNDSDCCSNNCSGGKPSTRVCLAN